MESSPKAGQAASRTGEPPRAATERAAPARASAELGARGGQEGEGTDTLAPAAVAAAAPSRDRPPASRSEEAKVADLAKPTKTDVAKLSMAEQSRHYDQVLDRLQVQQKVRLERINAKSQERLQRRQAGQGSAGAAI